MSLRDLDIRRAYHKGRGKDDIASDFYLPVVAASSHYDRAVGYFSSSIYLLAWPSLRQFVANGGRMRLLCSPVLSEQDELAMRQGYSDQANEDLATDIKRQFAHLLASPFLAKPVTVLASLIANGIVDCRIAWVTATAEGGASRIFHDKVGLLKDNDGNSVVFKGSMNESWPALSLDGNIESVDVFASWRDFGEQSRIADETRYFEDLWEGRWPGVTVKPLPDSARNEIVSCAQPHWTQLVDDICQELEAAASWSPESARQGGRLPRPHQIEALDAWVARGRRGILEHATGSGKTFTALCAIQASLRLQEVPIILVPSELLLGQWSDELRETFKGVGLQLLICGGGHETWRTAALLRTWSRPPMSGDPPRAILSTVQTASTTSFAGLCVGGDHLFLVGDEVHRLGAAEARRILTLDTGPRLGLSATPRRAGDLEGTAALTAYFRGVVPPPYTLEDAIRAGTLTPYAYHPHAVEFEQDEQDEWARMSAQIRRAYARGHAGNGSWDEADQVKFKALLINRARIAKAARRKIGKAVEIISSSYADGQRWIVYCDDQVQLSSVASAMRAAGVRDVFAYHAAMEGNSDSTLEVFRRSGGVVVAIRCLDEGVDIPAVSHALILASSRNPREFVQRRGRVLRRSPGKLIAHIHDLIITPSRDGDSGFDSMLRGELLRAIEFGSHAINPAGTADLRRIAARVNIGVDELVEGFEDDDSDTQARGVADVR